MTVILIGDDHPLVQLAMEAALKEIIKELRVLSGSSLEQVEKILRDSCEEIDLVLLDLNMPGSVGFAGLLLMQAEFPTMPVAILSAEQDPVTIHRAISFGAAGYIPKSLCLAEIVRAIVVILEGQVWSPIPFPMLGDINSDVDVARRFRLLSPQQLRILAGIVDGKLNKQIATDMGIAEQTVKVHVSVLMQKLGVQTRTQAAVMAERMTRRERWGTG